jgi:hypothetical protein
MSRQVNTSFGNYEVYPDNFRGQLRPDSNQVRESELKSLEQAWNNIRQGKGMVIQGSSADEVTWKNMLIEGMTSSQVFRETIANIGNDPNHTILIDLGRSQPNVLVDSFATKAVDLDDLQMFPASANAGQKNQLTRPEVILHFLEERHYAQTHDPMDFDSAHQSGINAQNHLRDERGQSHVLSQEGRQLPNGNIEGQFFLQNGTSERVIFDSNGNIQQIFPPPDQQSLPKTQQQTRSSTSPAPLTDAARTYTDRVNKFIDENPGLPLQSAVEYGFDGVLTENPDFLQEYPDALEAFVGSTVQQLEQPLQSQDEQRVA